MILYLSFQNISGQTDPFSKSVNSITENRGLPFENDNLKLQIQCNKPAFCRPTSYSLVNV